MNDLKLLNLKRVQNIKNKTNFTKHKNEISRKNLLVD